MHSTLSTLCTNNLLFVYFKFCGWLLYASPNNTNAIIFITWSTAGFLHSMLYSSNTTTILVRPRPPILDQLRSKNIHCAYLYAEDRSFVATTYRRRHHHRHRSYHNLMLIVFDGWWFISQVLRVGRCVVCVGVRRGWTIIFFFTCLKRTPPRRLKWVAPPDQWHTWIDEVYKEAYAPCRRWIWAVGGVPPPSIMGKFVWWYVRRSEILKVNSQNDEYLSMIDEANHFYSTRGT